MTATATRAEINRRNAARSTGPRTPEGKQRAKFNAVKHGMTAKTPVLPGEDPDAFRGRLDAWAEALGPDNAVEQFLVEQAATASWKIERADRIEAARLFAALRAAEDELRAVRRMEADRLGQLLGIDGPVADLALAQEALRILDPGNPAPRADRTAHLRPIVDRLESTAEGCAWLLERWDALRAPLERGTDWDEGRFVHAVRLSGRQPLDLPPEEWERHRQARHMGGVEELEPDGDEEWQEALEAAFSARVEAEDRRRMAVQLVEDLPEDAAGARSALLGMVERAIARLTELESAHEARWEAGAVERAERMTLDPGPDEERLWRYQFGCGRSMQRTLDTLLKLRREDRAAGRAAGREEGRSAAPPDAQYEAIAQAVAPPPCSPERLTNGWHTSLGVDNRQGPQPPLTPPSQGGEDRGTCASFPHLAKDGFGGGSCEGAMPAIGALDEAAAPVVATSPPPGEAAAPAVDRTPVPDEAATALDAPSSLQDEANAQFVGCSVSTDPEAPSDPVPADHPTGLPGSAPRTTSRGPVQGEAIAPVAAQPSPQNEATAPTRGAAREVLMVLVTALALLSSAGFAAALGRSTDLTPRPSPTSAHEPRGPRTTLPGGDPRGLNEIPPEGGNSQGAPYDTASTLPPRAATPILVVGSGNRRSAHGPESSYKGSLAPLAVAF